MNVLRAFFLTAVAVAGSTQAATLVIPTPNPVTLTYDATVMSVELPFVCRTGPVDCFGLSFVPLPNELTTGRHVYSFDFASSTPLTTLFSAFFSAYLLPQPDDVQIRFSYPLTIESISMVDRDSGQVLGSTPSRLLPETSAGGVTHLGIDMTFDFTAGNFLMPSNDPNCASISCMTAGSDRASVNFFAISAVPEPSQMPLALVGVTVAGYVARRRQGF